MSKNRGKSKLSKNVLFNANKHVFHCEKSLGTFFYRQPSYKQISMKLDTHYIYTLQEDIYINSNRQSITSIKNTLHRPKHKPKHISPEPISFSFRVEKCSMHTAWET
jgi:hypothetical protein